MSETAKIRLLPISWKENKQMGTLEGHIGTFLVGKILTYDNIHHVSVWKNGIQITGCEIEYTKKTAESALQQAQDYVKNKITDRVVSDHNNISSFLENE